MDNLFLNVVYLRIHQLIKRKQTGTPAQLAQKLNCAPSTVFAKIKTIKEASFPIQYDEEAQSYVYNAEVSLDFCLSIDGEVLKKIQGGSLMLTNNYQNNFATPKKSECEPPSLYLKSTII